MGCVLGREVSSGIVSESKEVKKLNIESNNNGKEDVVAAKKIDSQAVEVQNDEANQKEEKVVDGEKKPRGERRRSKPNPRLSNPPKHLRGEQVAAGWPSWLTGVCGEALNGWIPRRADSFEKIDKVGHLFLSELELLSICFRVKSKKFMGHVK